MPLIIGPNYFNSCKDPLAPNINQWDAIGLATGAPDGNYASSPIISTGFSDPLNIFNWAGVSNVIPNPINITNAIIDFYGYTNDGVALNFGLYFIYNGNTVGPQITGTLGFNFTPAWATLNRTGGGNFTYNGSFDQFFGIQLTVEAVSGPLSTIYIDSVRMTLFCGDGFYDPGYGFTKKKRRFVSRLNNREQIIFEQSRIRMIKSRKAG